MTQRHQPAATTRTVELEQVRQIDHRLGTPGYPQMTAGKLGMEGTPVGAPLVFALPLFEVRSSVGSVLAARDQLRRVVAEGSPEFPYVRGQFEDPATGELKVVELHSDALHLLCVAMKLSQCWGTEAVLVGSSIR